MSKVPRITFSKKSCKCKETGRVISKGQQIVIAYEGGKPIPYGPFSSLYKAMTKGNGK